MSTSPCEMLEDYLARDLAKDQEQAFEQHLTECLSCRRAATRQERIDALISEAVEKLLPEPDGLVPRIHVRLRRARQRRYLAYTASVAAAAAIVWGISQMTPRGATPVEPEPAPPMQITEVKEEPAANVQISFANESKLLIVPEKTESPDVTFVWVYRNQRAAQ